MKKQNRTMRLGFPALSIALGVLLYLSSASPSRTSAVTTLPVTTVTTATIAEPQECSKCEGKCKSWIDKCKDGGQYACYKAAACLCKCNLDAGGCGSSKDALQECYEQNEKLAKELGPSDLH